MSLLQKLEIDTLRLRNLIVRTSDNRVYPSDFTIFSRGDGGTYWSTSATSKQMNETSTSLAELTSTVINNSTGVSSTLNGTVSSILDIIASTVNANSSFTQNLSTYSVTVQYVDQQLGLYSTQEASYNQSTFTTITSTNELSTALNLSIISTGSNLLNGQIVLSNSLGDTTNRLNDLSTYVIGSQLGQSSIYGSTFAGMQSTTSTLYLEMLVLNANTQAFAVNQVGFYSTQVAPKFATYDTYPDFIGFVASTLSTSISIGDKQTLSSANAIISATASTVLSTVSASQLLFASSILLTLASTTDYLISTVNSTTKYTLNLVQTVSTTTSQQISSIAGNLSTIISTGILDTIYQTFIQLQEYSEYVILSTLSTTNNGFNSTSQYYITVYDSTLAYINESSFAYLVNQAYISSVSTLSPQVFSVMQSIISEQIIVFNSTIDGEIIYFESSISAQVRYFGSTISTFISTAEINVSSIVGEGVSTQYGLYSTAIETASTYIGGINYETLRAVSTIIGNQYTTAPSIIINSVDNISTLTNVSSVTGLSSLNVGIATIDITNNTNFYLLVSDIATDIFYGLSFKDENTSTTVYNRDIAIYVDIQSTYQNRFVTLDTDNLPNWLSTQRIINPYSYNVIANYPNTSYLPGSETTPQIYLSTFVGAYLMTLHYMKQGIYVKSILAYPYIYSRITDVNVTYPSNVEVTGPSRSPSTFTYRSGMLGLSWNTNDLNIPLGIKFVGTDSYGNNIIKWGGPFSSANLSAEVKIPGCAAPYVVYHTGFITVYPFDTDRSGSTDGNINTPFGQNFYEIAFPPLVVVNPTLNVRLTVANLDGVSKYLEIAELWINNEQKENIVTDYSNVYAKGWSTYTSVFNADEPGWGALKALDGDLTTFFKGGANSGSIDTDCQFELTLSSKTSVITSTTLISSIEIYPGPSYFGEGLIDMYLIISNYNEDGVDDELFKSTILINASTFIIGFS